MKDYVEWSKVKARINNTSNRPKGYDERQIWWCSVGENVGVESDGKGKNYMRPVLIIKKFGYMAFLGVPLTSQKKPEAPFYFPVRANNRDGFLIFSQTKTFDASRLIRKIEEMDVAIFDDVKCALGDYLGLNKIQSPMMSSDNHEGSID